MLTDGETDARDQCGVSNNETTKRVKYGPNKTSCRRWQAHQFVSALLPLTVVDDITL